MYSELTLEKVRNSIDIVELVGEYVALKKSGQGFTGLCPFHGEKTPSFHVHPLKQVFHCFGCHKGGNVFTFLCAIDGLPFPEAVQKLAARSGIELEKVAYKRERPAPPPGETKLLECLDWAAKYFHYLLTEGGKDYDEVRKYIASRGISEKTIKRFRIGVSPRGWNTLLGLMVKRKFALKDLIAAGLVIPKDTDPGGYDRFRYRLMFPILDREGRAIGFGARQLVEEENQPKYINSAESPLFSKRKNLYGLHENQRAIRLRGEAVIVEGYMDVVGLAEAGVDNAVATMGTAMTEEHCDQLKGITQRIITVFDPDSAGREAWHRSVHLVLGSGLFAKDLTLPDNQDPDEFVLEEGAEKFYELCRTAPQQVTKLLKEIAGRGALSEEETSKTLSELTPILRAARRLPDKGAVLRDNISLVLGMSPESLERLSEGKAPGQEHQRPRPIVVTKRNIQPVTKRTLNAVDLQFFQACLRWPSEFLLMEKEQWRGGIKDPRIESCLETLSAAKTPEQMEQLLAGLVHHEMDPELAASLSAGLFGADGTAQPEEPIPFKTITARITKRKKELEIQALSAQIRLTQRLGNQEEQMRLLERLNELRSS